MIEIIIEINKIKQNKMNIHKNIQKSIKINIKILNKILKINENDNRKVYFLIIIKYKEIILKKVFKNINYYKTNINI